MQAALQPYTRVGFPAARGQEILLGIAEGLHYLHNNQHMIHGDVKPENILLTSADVPKLCDFDAALPIGSISPLTRGTRGFMPPEVLPTQSQLQARESQPGAPPMAPMTAAVATDVWGFGLVVFMMVAGVTAWDLAMLRDIRCVGPTRC
jgi:serine/threonine protein kinase